MLVVEMGRQVAELDNKVDHRVLYQAITEVISRVM